MNAFFEAFEAAKAHSRAEYPKESCGVIADGVYVPFENVALPEFEHVAEGKCGCQLCSFVIDGEDYAARTAGKTVNYIVHSHPDGPRYPSKGDMEQQIATQVPWAIITTDGERVSDPTIWGEGQIAPMIGREFMHGVHDCYSIIRDTFRLGKDKLAEQDIEWPFDPIELPEVPRDDAWWELEGEDLYTQLFSKFGFEVINMADARPGDVFLCAVGDSGKLNHGGVLLGNDCLLHHLPKRQSRRDPSGLWGRSADLWIRYKHA
ncbi:Mov34/MPN/PAD-1 family protein [Phyllobacterium myrsinacearum]|uniref:Proteasome lid subunit RPN8/RPN11 n=1 Tax=Phyllobacterium myrsinacearum TaxID=28101 RepID=A0A839EW40_9HYPH|nr:Mov34/MPN/PAD-1 family protein [Phyllobacterium myrsinacearum]MBA8881734.1 proteasome lid subunit RPN8/RPN11 [Phyllobacterium myrsinacearum]